MHVTITRFYTVSVTIVYVCTYRSPKNGALRVHYGIEETTVNVRKMLKKFYWTYLLIWGSLKVALNRSIIVSIINHKVQDLILHNREFRSFENRKNYLKSTTATLQGMMYEYIFVYIVLCLIAIFFFV
jgi:hypothetical protein